MTLATALVVATLEAERMRYIALRNTVEWESARYAAEAGLNEAFAELASDITWRDGIATTEFPTGSGLSYSVTLTDGNDGLIHVTSIGQTGGFTRRLNSTVKQGG
ncbi:MAG: hypothetical protein AAFU85_21835 [Planctomycetota bacterium]